MEGELGKLRETAKDVNEVMESFQSLLVMTNGTHLLTKIQNLDSFDNVEVHRPG